MLSNCPIACDATKDCTDISPHCKYWAGKGECEKNAEYMDIYCYDTCHCSKQNKSDCQDEHENCAYWKSVKHCESSSSYNNYMRVKCKKSCNLC